jgi:hypothetical protein
LIDVDGDKDKDLIFSTTSNELYLYKNNTPISIDRFPKLIPRATNLAQNYPNPFNATTVIEFTVSQATNLTVQIYSVTGERVATLFEGFTRTGTHHLKLDGSDFASGIYFYTMDTGTHYFIKKCLLIK